MTKATEVDVVLKAAEPHVHQQAFGHTIRMPIALSKNVCKEKRRESQRAMARLAAELGHDGTNDLIVSDVVRRNELRGMVCGRACG